MNEEQKSAVDVQFRVEESIESEMLQDREPFMLHGFVWEAPELTGGSEDDPGGPVIAVRVRDQARFLIEYWVNVQRLPKLTDDPDYVPPVNPDTGDEPFVPYVDPDQMELFD